MCSGTRGNRAQAVSSQYDHTLWIFVLVVVTKNVFGGGVDVKTNTS